MFRITLYFTTLLLFISCAQNSKNNYDIADIATTWQQSSAELTALSYQAYNLARLQLESEMRKRHAMPLAIIVDVDETVLDNSPYQVKNMELKRLYNGDNWREWVELAKADAVAGAAEFLNFAASKGVKTFYVTNRNILTFEATFKNLKEKGFPISREQLMPKNENNNSKEKRRLEVLKKYYVTMYIGDALGDFHKDFEGRQFSERRSVVEKYKNDFGRKFIVLPNAMYGEWLESIYNYNHKLTEDEKSKLRQSVLKSY